MPTPSETLSPKVWDVEGGVMLWHAKHPTFRTPTFWRERERESEREGVVGQPRV
jgi:hypothetical protein